MEDKRKEEGMEWKISGKRRVWSGKGRLKVVFQFLI